MLKVIFATLIGVFIAISGIIILYWRDSKFEPTAQDLILYLGFTPLVIGLILLIPYFAVKWYQYNKTKKLESEQVVNQNEQIQLNDQQEVEYFSLNVLSTSLYHAFGRDHDVFNQIIQLPGPDLDEVLENNFGNRVLSYRIKEIESIENNSEYEMLAPLQMRMNQLIFDQLQENASVISKIAEHLKQSAIFYDSQLAYEYRMHPAWINPHLDINETEEDAIPVQVPRLNSLNLHIVLADALLHIWDEVSCTEQLEQYMLQQGIIPQQIKVEYHYWGAENAYSKWINLLQEIHQQEAEVSLFMITDSEIDQERLDDRFWFAEKYIPAEFAGVCCLSSPTTEVLGLERLKKVDIVLHEVSLSNTLQEKNINALPQFMQDHPFVVIPDDISKSTLSNQIEQKFSATPIKAYHYLYSQSSLGHTQHLSKLFGFLLGLHASEELHSLVYSIELPQTTVIFSPVVDEALSEPRDL